MDIKRKLLIISLLIMLLLLTSSEAGLVDNRITEELKKDFESLYGDNDLSKHLVQGVTIFACPFCKIQATTLRLILTWKPLVNLFEKVIAEKICPSYVTNSTVCSGTVKMYGDVLFYEVLDYVLDPDYFCEMISEECSPQDYIRTSALTFVESLLTEKPSSISDNNYLNDLYSSIYGQTRHTLKAVHITDVHIDYDYTIGTNAYCSNYICCHEDDGYPTDASWQAQEWGNLFCDVPAQTVTSMLEYVRDTINPDLFFWTGDNSPHKIWDQSSDEIIFYTSNLTLMIQDVFENTDISVYPIFGNHDLYPVNVQDFHEENSNTEINGFASYWLNWLDTDTVALFQKYGYYSQTLKLQNGTTYSTTKIIGLNTQACNQYNVQLLTNRYDPGDQLNWLENELSELEAIGGQAIMMSHMPTYKECAFGWGHRFRGILDRYQHVVRFSLYGHTHDEDIQVIKSVKDSSNIGINFISGAFTPHVLRNPSFTVIEIDEEYMIPVNFKTYYMNLASANTLGTATWELLHDFISTYSLTDLRPDNIYQFADDIRNSESLAMTYLSNRKKQGYSYSYCDETCRQQVYCDMSSSETFQNNMCKGRVLYDFQKNLPLAIFKYLIKDWILQI